MKLDPHFPKVKAIFTYSHKTVRFNISQRTKRLFSRLKKGGFSKVHILVYYGIFKTNRGHNEMFTNEGTYENNMEAYRALRAFIE